jgi:hypothetical protein
MLHPRCLGRAVGLSAFGLGFRRIAPSQLNVKFIVMIAKGEASKPCQMPRTGVRGAGCCSLEESKIIGVISSTRLILIIWAGLTHVPVQITYWPPHVMRPGKVQSQQQNIVTEHRLQYKQIKTTRTFTILANKVIWQTRDQRSGVQCATRMYAAQICTACHIQACNTSPANSDQF